MRLVVGALDRGVGPVWLEDGALAFPERGWSDFAVRVVHEFVVSTRALQHAAPGERARAQFYDGPHAVTLERTSDGIRALTEASTPFEEWQSGLHDTARAVLAACAAQAWTSPDLDLLAAHVPPKA